MLEVSRNFRERERKRPFLGYGPWNAGPLHLSDQAHLTSRLQTAAFGQREGSFFELEPR